MCGRRSVYFFSCIFFSFSFSRSFFSFSSSYSLFWQKKNNASVPSTKKSPRRVCTKKRRKNTLGILVCSISTKKYLQKTTQYLFLYTTTNGPNHPTPPSHTLCKKTEHSLNFGSIFVQLCCFASSRILLLLLLCWNTKKKAKKNEEKSIEKMNSHAKTTDFFLPRHLSPHSPHPHPPTPSFFRCCPPPHGIPFLRKLKHKQTQKKQKHSI